MTRPLTCKHCGSERGFRENGTATCDASRESRKIEMATDGRIKVTWGEPDTDDFGADFDPDFVTCRGCGAEASAIEDLVGPLVSFEPGDRVRLPDGFDAVVATVDEDARTLQVRDSHETFEFAEVSR